MLSPGDRHTFIQLEPISDNHFSELVATAEKIGWPMNINYDNTSLRDRESFEGAFVNLLNLQRMWVIITSEEVN